MRTKDKNPFRKIFYHYLTDCRGRNDTVLYWFILTGYLFCQQILLLVPLLVLRVPLPVQRTVQQPGPRHVMALHTGECILHNIWLEYLTCHLIILSNLVKNALPQIHLLTFWAVRNFNKFKYINTLKFFTRKAEKCKPRKYYRKQSTKQDSVLIC